MFDRDLWREIFQSINMNKTRSLLSGFTVAFAILLFAILFGLGNGLLNTFDEGFVDDANNSIAIWPGRTTKASKGMQAGRRIQFTNDEYDFLKDEYGDKIEFITSRILKNANVSFRGEKNDYPFRAIHPDNIHIEQNKVVDGRYINQNDIDNKTKVTVIGRLVEQDLFLKTTAVGKYININGLQYKVVGVFSDEGGDDEERMVYIPLSTAQQVYGNNDYIDFMYLTYNPNMSSDQALAFGNSITKKLKNRFSVSASDQRAVRVENMAQGTKAVETIELSINILVLVIGFGTLIAGIVGVSNIMIFIVKERTKEIGIRKALGAQPKSIVSIILLESILITIIAGFVGLFLGMWTLDLAAPMLEDYFLKDPSVDTSTIFGATITLIIAGAIAGYLPAKKASRIKPIVALRDE